MAGYLYDAELWTPETDSVLIESFLRPITALINFGFTITFGTVYGILILLSLVGEGIMFLPNRLTDNDLFGDAYTVFRTIRVSLSMKAGDLIVSVFATVDHAFIVNPIPQAVTDTVAQDGRF